MDAIAKRYGVLPSDVLHLSAEDFDFVRIVINSGIEDENKQAKKQMAKMRSKGRR
jgi:hypothetical protein